jgi:adenylosuccinate lyase
VALSKLPVIDLAAFSESEQTGLKQIWQQFSEADALQIKETERTTNHDVKAVEYFVKAKLDSLKLGQWKEFVHFGLTSQDINNTAIPLSLKEASLAVLIPQLETIINALSHFSKEWEGISMLARTHGQPASPTKLGKEFKVFEERLKIQLAQLRTIPFSAKFGGATGNFNAHLMAYPEIDWVKFANNFVEKDLGLNRSQTTTQIEHYDNLAAWCHNVCRINTILLDLCRDVWAYISMDYFKQKIKVGEIGSSAMPHKVNPIDFENAEGNLGLANALLEHLAAKLPISRLQRDLTDSTVLRNIGVPIAHSLIALKSIEKGFGKLIVNEAAIEADLENNWAVIAEAIQTVLRKEGVENPYELLKSLSRTHKKLTKTDFLLFIEELPVRIEIKEKLKQITPQNYTGVY